MGNCTCIFCYLGKSKIFDDNDIANKFLLLEFIQDYDLTLTVFPLSERRREIILKKIREIQSTEIHFETLIQIFENTPFEETPNES